MMVTTKKFFDTPLKWESSKFKYYKKQLDAKTYSDRSKRGKEMILDREKGEKSNAEIPNIAEKDKWIISSRIEKSIKV